MKQLAFVALFLFTLPLIAGEQTRVEYRYDGFGRLWQERQAMPDGSTSVRETIREAGGTTISVSEKVASTTVAPVTKFEYDFAGRVTKVHPPDEAGTHDRDVLTAYTGDRLTSRTVKVFTGAATDPDATTIETRDREGQLVSVVDPMNTTGTYSYDIAGRLISAQVKGLPDTPVQTRTFNYDNRGFLRSETHPEKGGATSYTRDALGNVTRSLQGAESRKFDLRYDYDSFGRLRTVSNFSDVGVAQPIKEFSYGAENTLLNGVTNWAQGKLVSATRHNRVAFSTYTNIPITETYRYEDTNGAVSHRSTIKTSCQTSCSGTTEEQFDQTFTYDPLGRRTGMSYPACVVGGCTAIGGNRSVQTSYSKGFASDVTGYASLSYHNNGMLAQIAPGGSVAPWVQNLDSNLARPSSIGGGAWSTQAYSYDASGNIKAIGTNSFTYDLSSRVMTGTAGGQIQSYSYDGFGNIKTLTTGAIGAAGTTYTNHVDAATNRLAETYDEAGNQLTWSAAPAGALTLRYDGLGMVERLTGGLKDTLYVYTPDDERIFSFSALSGRWAWRLRDLDKRVLREWTNAGGWAWSADYIHHPGGLLAAELPGGKRHHFYADHLGSTRYVVDANGNPVMDGSTDVSRSDYLPFGLEATPILGRTSALRFTGHERDFNGGTLSDNSDYLDYMHARYYSPVLGRFLSVDPQLDLGRAMLQPQTWNRYSYAGNNPVRYVDPDGRSFLDYLNGIGQAVSNNLTLGVVSRPAAVNGDARVGQAFGDLTSMAIGVGEVVQGTGLIIGGGLAAAPTGGLSLGASAVGGAEAIHGIAVIGTAAKNLFAAMSSNGGGGGGSDSSREKSIRSLQNRIDEHKQKLEAYKKNPDAYDNKGHLKNAPNEKVRQSIIDGRVRHLQNEIDTFTKDLNALRGSR